MYYYLVIHCIYKYTVFLKIVVRLRNVSVAVEVYSHASIWGCDARRRLYLGYRSCFKYRYVQVGKKHKGWAHGVALTYSSQGSVKLIKSYHFISDRPLISKFKIQ